MTLLPRLTSALRAFSGVCSQDSAPTNLHEELTRKRWQQRERLTKDNFSWHKLMGIIQKHCNMIDPGISGTLKILQHSAREIVGKEAAEETVESAIGFFFEVFQNVQTVGQQETAKLRGIFGPFPAGSATQACGAVNQVLSWIPEESLSSLGGSERGAADGSAETEYFGASIKFVHPNSSGSTSADDDDPSSSDSESEKSGGITLDFKYRPATVDTAAKEQQNATGKEKASSEWLQEAIVKYFAEDDTNLGLSPSDLCTTIFDILSSNKTDDELQNDLFDLLGFDRFEFIQALLEKRMEIIAVTFESAPDLNELKAAVSSQSGPHRPNYGCQITVQTEQEKKLTKLYRKEEKRFSKLEAKFTNDQDNESAPFDPQMLRTKREASLRDAAVSPLLLSRGRVPEREQYPHVFDALREAQQSSAYVGGQKMLLPEGFERVTNEISEEVHIPASAEGAIQVGKNRILIADLDEIGQLAFKGTKALNRIQSVVFDVAYKTNENLLICAPTGAGKTNIAMLTILNEIKQHITDEGVIKKDEFKIIYVAPMKALAAEMVRNFGGRLGALGIAVKELTGDMQLTKAEIMKTQMLVTTPEKWDVVTRKSTGDVALTQLVKLLIIDEVHLLHDDRGAVLESLVARTLRQVESSQSMIRIVGLSATLPNYLDVAHFLNVNPFQGLFFFDGRFRPVPLAQTFIGVKQVNRVRQLEDMNEICYQKVRYQVKAEFQVMVFVHARNETVRTAMVLREKSKNRGDTLMFQPPNGRDLGDALKAFGRSRNKQLGELFPDGFAIHHAGMLRSDRNLVEHYFSKGLIKVLVCTSTLAWGVNLPAHAVIIKGTQIYDAKHGAFVDLGILDVLQIFGRAGRPQFDTHGHGTILTSHNKLSHYLSLLTRQTPIESQFITSLTDNLNAEITLGTVTNVDEAVQWLSYTYLYVRMRCNPLVYGIDYGALQEDPTLQQYRQDLIVSAARKLDQYRMIRFDERTGYFAATDLGRVSSHYYIKYDTVGVINEHVTPVMTEADVLATVAKSSEFNQIKVREEEMEELDFHLEDSCVMQVPGGSENTYGKVNILLQAYVSRANMDCFSLISDQAYVAQNAARIVRALFEVALKNGWPIMTSRLLALSKTVDKRIWPFETPLRQFPFLSQEILWKIEHTKLSIDRLKEMDSKEIGQVIRYAKMGPVVRKCINQIPCLDLEATIQPITRTVLRVRLTIVPEFKWDDKIHGLSEPFWVWVEDPDNDHIYHSEYFLLHKKQAITGEPQHLVFTIPIFEPLPTQYYVKAVSDRWIGAETMCAISFQHLILPERHPPHTELLDLQPLPVTALNDMQLAVLYKFSHFNPIQTQIFHTLYHTDTNVLLGAPTGSGKTVAAELAIFRVFREYPKHKAVYIAPLKALVRERMEDWKIRIEQKLGKKVVELTGDVTPDMRAIAAADLIVTTPEKWDGVSRSWQTRSYVKAVALLVIDEIHLLGNDRGPVLEVIVSRTNFISSHTSKAVRVVGLSTALANARDLADWLSIKETGLFNFRPSVRPVPLEVHIAGYAGKHYCPRMATMNKPTYQAIRTHSPEKPVLVFVSSRRQTRLTALDLIAFLAADDNPKQWLLMSEVEMDNIITGIKDTNLKLTLAFGLGIHHAGLVERDRKTVEELFVNQKIMVLIATSTLAWGVNFPAHLVVVKGTEYFDGKTRKYVDFPITDVLQMMGRAGRPQFDDQGKAVILVQDIKKHFYKKFLYEPFPVESNLLAVLAEHMNAEVVAGTVTTKQDAMDYITWTYFFRRLVMNPSYYHLGGTNHEVINHYLSDLVEKALSALEASYCLEISDDNRSISTKTLGRIASYYYLHHTSVRMFQDQLRMDSTTPDLIEILSNVYEYAELPVRHNEDLINSELAQKLPIQVNQHSFDSSHTKTHLLLQAHFCQAQLPTTDYTTDTKSVLDQAIRICQAMLDVSADNGWVATSLRIIQLIQMIVQGRWVDESTLLSLPHMTPYYCYCFSPRSEHAKKRNFPALSAPIESLPELIATVDGRFPALLAMLEEDMDKTAIDQIYQVLSRLPQIVVSVTLKGWWEGKSNQQSKPISLHYQKGPHSSKPWLAVHADQEYVLRIELLRINKNKKYDAKAYAPRFPKPKDEGWFLIVGQVDNGELIALKRVGYIQNRTSVQLAFYTPESVGRVIYTVYLMSDTYLGLDQQYDLRLDVIEANIEAQANTELADDFADKFSADRSTAFAADVDDKLSMEIPDISDELSAAFPVE